MDGEQHDAIRARLRSRLGAGGGQYPEIAARLRKRLQKGDKGEVRGDILPVARSGDGSLSFAMPNILREAGVGLLDLMTAPSTGQITPEATEFMVNMTPGAGATAAVRPSAVGSLGVFGGRVAKQAKPDLPMDEASRLARALEMGFDERDLYHATSRSFDEFDVGAAGTGANAGLPEGAVFLTDRPEVADSYLGGAYVNRATTPADASADMGGGVGRHYMEGSQVMPLRVRGLEDFDVWDYYGGGYTPDDMAQAIKEARKAGAPGVVLSGVRDPGIMDAAGPVGNPRKPGNTVVVFDPASIRSRFAAFDPAKRDSANLLAANVPTGVGPLELAEALAGTADQSGKSDIADPRILAEALIRAAKQDRRN